MNQPATVFPGGCRRGMRMVSERDIKIKKTTTLHLAMEANNILMKIGQDFSDSPESMHYFYDFLKGFYTNHDQTTVTQPLIGTMCVQVPDELIYAVGARPWRLCCGANSCDQVGSEFMPAKSCPLVKATTGYLYANRLELSKQLKAIIIPSTCDQKRKSAEMISEMGYRVFMLEMPLARDGELATHYWQESIKKLAAFLQNVTKRKITATAVKKGIHTVGRASEAFRQIYNLRKQKPPVISGVDTLLVNNSYFLDDIEHWADGVNKLHSELKERKQKNISVGNRSAPRILLTGSPPIFPNIKVPLMLEEAGAVIVADEVCSSTRLLYDMVVYDEPHLYDMIPAIADRYLKACTCPCFSTNENRKRKLIEMSNEFDIDGVVYQAFSGCMVYEMERKSVSDVQAQSTIPMLYVETDYSPEDQGQLSTRIEAFIESIKTRRRKTS